MDVRARRWPTAAALLTLSAALSSATPRAEVRAGAASATTSAPEVIVRGGWLWDGIGDVRVRNAAIVIRDGAFIEVGADLIGRDLSAAQVVDLDDEETILPGLFDLHAHYSMDLLRDGRVEEVTYNPIIYLANGVTSTWTAGEFFPDLVAEARDRIDAGHQTGARIFTAGPYFGAARCLGARTHRDACKDWPQNITLQQIRDQVDYWAERGVRSIKVKLASPEQMQAVIEQAHTHGLTVAAHMHNYEWRQDVDPAEAVLMGLDRIEHTIVPPEDILRGTSGPGTTALTALVALLLAHNVYFDATMSVYGRGTLARDQTIETHWTDERRFFTPYMRRLFEQRAAWTGGDREYARIFKHKLLELKAFYDAGGGPLLTVGTDRPTAGPDLAGFEYHRELQAMVYAGLPPVAVLKAATINGARALGLADRLGSIATGKLADLVVTAGNPLARIEDARDVRLVIKSGQVYVPKALLQSVEGRIGPTGPDDVAAWARKP